MSSGQLGFGFDAVPPAPTVIAEAARPVAAALIAVDRRNDGIFEVALASSRNMLVPWYLIASWAYFVCDHPLLTDARFDQLCRELDAEWETVGHRHKDLVDRAWLSAGTCGLARTAYPASVRGAAAHLAAADGVRIPRS